MSVTVYNKTFATYTIETEFVNGVVSGYSLGIATNVSGFNTKWHLFEPNQFNKIEPFISKVEKQLHLIMIMNTFSRHSGVYNFNGITENDFSDVALKILDEFDV